MTHTKRQGFDPTWKSTLEFEDIFNGLFYPMTDSLDNKNSKYPPYNIVKYSPVDYAIEMAVAGFTKEDITIDYKDSTLSVLGSINHGEENTHEFLHRGIATRDFQNRFRLSDGIEVIDASIQDGILKIVLKRHIPEHLQPRKIEIN